MYYFESKKPRKGGRRKSYLTCTILSTFNEGLETVILFCDLVVGDKSVFNIGYGMELVNSRM